MNIRRTASAILIGLAALALSTSCATSSTPTVTPAAAQTPWLPAGYTKQTNDIAIKIAGWSKATCKSYQHDCINVTLSSRYACSAGFYVEVTFVDNAGVSVKRAVDITPGVEAGGVTEVTLSPTDGRLSTDITGYRPSVHCVG